jgi:hypothetical protein
MTTVAYQGPDSSPNVMSCGYYINIPGHQPQLMSGYEIQGDGLPGEVLATRSVALAYYLNISNMWTVSDFSPSWTWLLTRYTLVAPRLSGLV